FDQSLRPASVKISQYLLRFPIRNLLKSKLSQKPVIPFCRFRMPAYICAGEMAERSNAAVLKTVDCNRSGGSNPSLSANQNKAPRRAHFYGTERRKLACKSDGQK